MTEPERVAVARPRRASLVLAHLLPLIAIVTVIGVLDGRASALQALPFIGTGRDRRTVAWDDILSASYLGGSFMWGMVGSISSGVHLETTLPTPERLFEYDGELTIGRLQPLFFWERDAVEAEATAALRRFLGSRVDDP